MTRQERWLSKGYTQEQIDVHLEWERRKSKEARERRKANNLKNQEIIKQIKTDLLNKEFSNDYSEIKIISIRETVDGKGFWYKILKEFNDGSSGEFRYFYYFDEYNKKKFLETLFH